MTFSVRFYKRLILLFLALLIIIPTVFAVVFGVQNAALERRVTELETGGKPGTVPTASASPTPAGDPSAVPTSYDRELDAEPIYYQTLYPDLYGTAQVGKEWDNSLDKVYLTFDCMPGTNTTQIMDILDVYGIKATFFVMGATDEESLNVMRDIVARGHTIGLRSYSGSLQQIYDSVAAYLEDFDQIYNLVYETTGVKAEIFRFPRGSVNSYNSGIYEELIAEMLRRNFVFFDWNVPRGSVGSSAQEISANVIEGMSELNRGIIMFQDVAGNENMIGALPAIIEGLQSQGYSFQPLSASVWPVVFSYRSTP